MSDTPTKDLIVDSNTVKQTQFSYNLQPAIVNFPEGPAYCIEGSALTIWTILIEDNGEKVVVAISTLEIEGQRFGAMIPMSADHARGMAASLLSAANEIDAAGSVH